MEIKMSYFERVSAQTPTRFWINNVTRGQAALAVSVGAVGCTQNPSYTYKMLTNPQEQDFVYEKMDRLIAAETDDREVEVMLQRELVAGIAEYFLPLYEKSHGKQGYVSIQGDPYREDANSIVHFAEYNASAAPNIMAKIPVTNDGLEAIEYVARQGIAINATEVMAVKQALDVCERYVHATKDMSNPAPIYFSHITGILDEYIQKTVKQNGIDISSDVLWQAGISLAKKTYYMVKERNYPVGFIGGGARGLHHFTEMVGADAAITINWDGTADKLLEQNPPVVQRFLAPTPDSVIDELCEKLEDYRRAYFVNAITANEYEGFGPVVLFRSSFEKAWSAALDIISQRRARL